MHCGIAHGNSRILTSNRLKCGQVIKIFEVVNSLRHFDLEACLLFVNLGNSLWVSLRIASEINLGRYKPSQGASKIPMRDIDLKPPAIGVLFTVGAMKSSQTSLGSPLRIFGYLHLQGLILPQDNLLARLENLSLQPD